MKLIKIIVIVGLMSFSIFSCQKADDLMQNVVLGGGTSSSVVDVDANILGGKFNFIYTSSTSWMVSQIPDWISFSKTKGNEGTTQIEVSYQLNDTRSDRTAMIFFKDRLNQIVDTLTIRQTFPFLKVNGVENDTVNHKFLWNDGEQKDSVVSNVAWKISMQAGYAHDSAFVMSKVSGMNDDVLIISPYGMNCSKEEYECIVKVCPVMTENGIEKAIPEKAVSPVIIKLHQNNLRFLVNGSTDDSYQVVNELNENPSCNYSIDSELDWSISKIPDWVKAKKISADELEISVNAPNPVLLERKDTVRIITEPGAVRNVIVSQKAYVFDVDKSSISLLNEDKSEHVLTVHTTGTWEITNIPSWLSVSPMRCDSTSTMTGRDTYEVRVKAVDQNMSFDQIRNDLLVKSTMNDLTSNIFVSQDKFHFTAIIDTTLSRIPTLDTTSYPVIVDVSGEWYISGGDENWTGLDIWESEKSGETLVHFNAKSPNPDLSKDRKARYYLHSRRHESRGVSYRPIPIDIKQRKFVFTVSPSEKWFAPAYPYGSTVRMVDVDCSTVWKIDDYPDWIDVNPKSGDGKSVVAVSIVPKPNIANASSTGPVYEYKSREGKVTFSADNSVGITPIVIDVNQAGFRFNAEESVFTANETKNVKSEIQITCSGPWYITDCPDWISFDSMNGSDDQVLGFSIDDNINTSDRQATVYLRSSLYESGNVKFSKKISITQKPYIFNTANVSLAFEPLPKFSQSVEIQSSGEWAVDTSADWVTTNAASRKGGNGGVKEVMKIEVGKNTNLYSRMCTVTAYSLLNPELRKMISINQKAYEFAVNVSKIKYLPVLDDFTRNTIISVDKCSGTWKAETEVTWLSLSDTKTHSGSGTVVVSVDDNPTYETRSSVITIANLDDDKLSKTIEVVQDAFEFSVDVAQDTTITVNSVDPISISVNCSGKWGAHSSEAWVSLTIENNKLIITPHENKTKADRETVISISNVVNSDVKSFKIKQTK